MLLFFLQGFNGPKGSKGEPAPFSPAIQGPPGDDGYPGADGRLVSLGFCFFVFSQE